jgi:shikimate kinase
MTVDKIYLVGFVACGKSTVARMLAARLGWSAEDVDDLIEKHERMTIAETFARRGEPHFRTVERQMLKLLVPIRHVVVATGGGTFADADNRATINLDGLSVWLDVPLPELIQRIPLDGRRPLAADRATLERLYHARVEAYRMAHLHIQASEFSPARVVDAILDAMEQRPLMNQTASQA